MIGLLAVVTTLEGTTTKVESYFYDYNGTFGDPENWKLLSTAVSGVIDQPGNVVIASRPDSNHPEYPQEGDALLHEAGLWLVIEDR